MPCDVISIANGIPVFAKTLEQREIISNIVLVAVFIIDKNPTRKKAALQSGKQTAARSMTHIFLRTGRMANYSTRHGNVASNGKRCQKREKRR